MIQSLTGFGESRLEIGDRAFSVEIKTLNSRYADIQIHMPAFCSKREPAVRNFLSQSLQRGKVTFSLVVERADRKRSQAINTAIVQDYMAELQALVPALEPADALAIAMRLPAAIGVAEEPIDEAQWQQVMQAVRAATAQVIDFRRKEGEALARDLTQGIQAICAFSGQLKPFEAERVARVEAKLRESLARAAQEVDENRLAQELIYHLQRLDVSEEQARLQSHLDHFLKQLQSPERNGKILGFISQEIGREINTLGTKANHVEWQRIVVQMKAALEGIKEQIPNVL